MYKQEITPQQINTSTHFWGMCGNYEAEMVARSIVILSKRNNGWIDPFTWEQFSEAVDHNANYHDQKGLRKLIDNGLLDQNGGGKYSVNENFVLRVSKYMNACD